MNIAVITGGETGEREVSINSAKNIADLIDFSETTTFIFPDDLKKFHSEYNNFDLVIPIIHGKGGEDGSIQGYLEQLQLPYLFSGIQAHAIGIDKLRTKQIANLLGYKTPLIADKDTFPFFAKPRFGGSSVNSGLCLNESQYNKLSLSSEELILEELVHGREFTVGVVEYGDEVIPLPVVEIVVPKDTFFDYDQKYNPQNLAQEICPAIIHNDLSEKLKAIALRIHQELGVSHISRSDFIVSEDGETYFLEINTIPGMTNTSLIPKMLGVAGVNMKLLFKEWCENRIR